MRIKLLLIGLLLVMGCANAISGLQNVQEKYKNDVVINIPRSDNQFIVIKKDGTVRYITTNQGAFVNDITTDVVLYKKEIEDEN